MGPFCVTPSNPTHQLTDPTQPNSLQVGKFGPNPTQPNTTNNGTYTFALYTLHLPTFVLERVYFYLGGSNAASV